MESIRHHDRYLDPPDIPEFAECDNCHDVFHADDLNDHGICGECESFLEACEQELE